MMNRDRKGCFIKGHSLGLRFGNGQSSGSKDKYKKISEVQKGREFSKEHKNKISTSLKGHTPWNKDTVGLVKANSGSFTKGRTSGENNVNWNGGTSFEPYTPKFNKELKEEVRKRDGYRCKECGYSQEELGYKLPVHHIDYDKKNSVLDNLITLCRSCHAQTLYKRDDWISYFKRKADTYDGFVVGQNI
jgi:hypothetical protein